MKEILERFSTVLLIGLILMKVSAFHVYDHHDTLDDSNDHCELCVMAIEGQESKSLTPSITIVQCVSLEITSQPKISSQFEIQLNAIEEGILFSRPPPRHLA